MCKMLIKKSIVWKEMTVFFNYEETLKIFAKKNFILAFLFCGHAGG